MELVEYSKVPLVYFPDNVGPEDLELINRAYRKENRQGLFLSLQAPLKPLGLDGVIDYPSADKPADQTAFFFLRVAMTTMPAPARRAAPPT